MKKSIITAIGIIALSIGAQAQINNNLDTSWKPWKPENRSAGIYFKSRLASSVYGLNSVVQGNQFAEVDELSNMGQYIKTKPGTVYNVKFAFAHRQAAGDKALRVAMNGELVFDLFVDNNTAPGTFAYKSFKFRAKQERTFLGFYVISLSGDPNRGVLIDDVSMTTEVGSDNLIADGGFELRKKPIKRTARSSKGVKSSFIDEWAMLEDEPEGFDPATNFQIGQYYYYHSQVPARSLVHFELAKKGNFKHVDMEFYLARAYHLNHRFGDAVAHYYRYHKQLRSSSDAKASEKSASVKGYIEDCMTGTALLPDSLELDIRNLGNLVNSNYQDYIPLVSADESTLIFTSRRRNSTGREVASDGSFYEDIFISTRNSRGNWSKPAPIQGLNSEMHDAGIGLSSDGKQLFLFKDVNGGDILVSNRKSKGWSTPEALRGEVNSHYWEGSASISKDDKYLYFASNRPGGYGGIDIYRAERQANGVWGKVTNMGPEINTAGDEDAPQIHSDNITLFFSSTGHEGMGGYDIFSTVLDAATNSWTEPRNVGYPINTAFDDIHFSLNSAGTRAYFNSSYLTADGQNDIYLMERPETSSSLFLLKGKVVQKSAHQSVAARITLTNHKTREVQTATTTDLKNGTYTFSMAFNTDYSMSVESGDEVFNTRNINIQDQADLFQYVMNFVVDSNKMFIIEQQDISQIAMNEKNSYVVLANSR